jgi:hypothetical protein
METTYYLSTLTEIQIEVLNAMLEKQEVPNWDLYQIPAEFENEIKLIFNFNEKFRNPSITGGIFKPKPTKAPPPRYVKAPGQNPIQIQSAWPASNNPETLPLTGNYEIKVVANSNNATVVVFYDLPGHEIVGMLVEDVLFDADDELGTNLKQNLLIKIMLAPKTMNRNLLWTLPISFNPSFVSLAPKKTNSTNLNFLQDVQSGLSFNLYKLT